jgi:hypothetical protein
MTNTDDCEMHVAAGKYVLSKCQEYSIKCYSGSYKKAHVVKLGETSYCDACPKGTYSHEGAGSCTECPAGYNDSHGGRSVEDCMKIIPPGSYMATEKSPVATPCPAGTYSRGVFYLRYGSTSSCEVCKKSTYSLGGGGSESCIECPKEYFIYGTNLEDHDEKEDCKITCIAGQRVVKPDEKCTTPEGDWYTDASHIVSAGKISVAHACPKGYGNSGRNHEGHNELVDCEINCPAGTRIVAPRDQECTSPAGGWYSRSSHVGFGEISGIFHCAKGFNSDSTEASGHDEISDCVGDVPAGHFTSNRSLRFRYLKFMSAGNSVDSLTQVLEITAYDFKSKSNRGEDMLFHKPEISGQSVNPEYATDGWYPKTQYTLCPASGCVWDIGSVQGIDEIQFVLYTDGRIYHDVSVLISTDNVNWTQVFGPTDVYTSDGGPKISDEIILPTAFESCAIGSYAPARSVGLGQSLPCIPCQDGKTTSAAGQSSCDADCPNNNAYAIRWASAIWRDDNNTVRDRCMLLDCVGGYTMNYYTNTPCFAVGAGKYRLPGSRYIYECPAGLTTSGYGPGADEAGDCGRKLNFGDDTLYLRSDKKTTPALAVKVGSTTFYGNMSTDTKGHLRINSNGTKYSVYDDNM